MDIKPPCLGCKNRALYCHDSCAKYLEFKDLGTQIKEARIKYKESISNIARHQRGRCKV